MAVVYCGGLAHIDSFSHDTLAHDRTQGIWCHQVDLAARYLFKKMLQSDELEQTNRAVELDKDIHIALW